jgi:hypothetical protein
VIEPHHQAVTSPELNVMAIDHALGSFDCLGITRTNQRLTSYEMSVASDGKCPILVHP